MMKWSGVIVTCWEWEIFFTMTGVSGTCYNVGTLIE